MRAFNSIRSNLRAATAVIALLFVPMMSVEAGQSNAKSKGSKPAVDIMLMQPSATAVKSGDNQFEVMVNGADGKPISDADVSVVFVMPAMPAMKMAEMRNEVKLTSAGGGTYTGTGQVTMAGKWTVTVSVKRGGKEIGRKKLTVTAS